MKLYHKNPRQISEKQLGDLRRWLRELGDLGGIVHDLGTDEIISGNQRGHIMGLLDLNHADVVVTETFDEPDEQGTVGLGYVVWNGKRYGYRQVRWTDQQREQANIVANRAGGDWDFDILANEWDVSELLEWGFTEYQLQLDGVIVPDFGPVDESEQPRLDQKAPVTCPEYGAEFVPK